MKTVILTSVLMLTASFGFAQKNIILHKNVGGNVKTIVSEVDSITFSDFATPGTLTFDTYTDPTYLMNTHSKVYWEASYKGSNATIAGGFDHSEANFKFDAANPGNIKFDGKVRLSSANTFEPGREGPGHCVLTSLGVVWTGEYNDTTYRLSGGIPLDTIVTTVYPPEGLDDATDWATLVANPGSVVAYGDGYKATATFTFRGVSAPVSVYLTYIGSVDNSATVRYHNFEADFSFPAGITATDPWYCGNNIKSTVNVRMPMIMQQNL
ncbi:MAG: YceI family protein [Flavobacteriales bacterium]|nr:YceI family protein [Flavobacteriales bacterium]